MDIHDLVCSLCGDQDEKLREQGKGRNQNIYDLLA